MTCFIHDHLQVQEASVAKSIWQKSLTKKTREIMGSVNYNDIDPDLQRQIRLLGFSPELTDPEDKK